MKRLVIVLSLFTGLTLSTPSAFAQSGLDPAVILKPLADQWTTYSGDYSGKRFSSLKAVNPATVKNLSLAWVTRFTTGCGPAGVGGSGSPGGGGGGGRFGGGEAAPI